MTPNSGSLSNPQPQVEGDTRVYRAPGRVNLIGEHTDYNDGYVMPAAISLSCRVEIQARKDHKLFVRSADAPGSTEADLDHLPVRGVGQWADYVMGVVVSLAREGFKLRGANLHIQSEVPLGGGLSSSAALETSVGYALVDFAGYKIDPRQLALLCQRAENEFVGARCGIMDQFIACHGRNGHALLLDCRTLDFRLVPIPNQVQFVICNTMVKHEIAKSEYNLRRVECEHALRILAGKVPQARALRDIDKQALDEHRAMLPPVLYKRALHVIEENDRVLKADAALNAGDLRLFGELMSESHRSLRENYEVSCEELNLMVEIASQQKGVYGARMTGGGFGGSTINLVQCENTVDFVRHTSDAYYLATGCRPAIYVCDASDGVGEVSPGTPPGKRCNVQGQQLG